MLVFEPNYTRIVSSVRKNLGITQSVVEVKLQANEEDVKEVFSIGAKSGIVKSELSGNEISFVGLIDFQAMVGSSVMGMSAIDYSAEFKDKYLADNEIRGEVVLTSNVVDVTTSIVSNGIKVVAIVEVIIDIIESNDVNVLTSVSGDVETSTRELEYMTYMGKATEKFDVSDEIILSGASKIYMVTPCVSLFEVTPKDNFAVISGMLNLDICYGKGEDINDITTHNHVTNFTWEVALDEMKDNSYVQSLLSIISNEIKVSTSIDGDGANLNVVVPINYMGFVFNKNCITIIDDIYSKTNFMSLTSEKVDVLENKSSIKIKDNVSGVATISDNAPFIDDVLGVSTNNIVLASSRIESGVITVEGIANSTVLYYTKETGSVTSAQVEMPFVVEQKVEGCESGIVTMCLNDLCAKSRRGKEIEVSAELNIYTDIYSINNLCVVSEVNMGEEKPIDDCSLYIYIVKPNQTLWDIAKEMSVSEEMIIEQNPDIQLPLSAGAKLVVYNPKIMMF